MLSLHPQDFQPQPQHHHQSYYHPQHYQPVPYRHQHSQSLPVLSSSQRLHQQPPPPPPHHHSFPQPAPQHHQPHHHQQSLPPPADFYTLMSMGSPSMLETMTTVTAAAAAAKHRQQQDASVAQALEIARESPDGASDPTISKILETALADIWGKVQAQPDSYVMTRDEFAVFNFFQHRFQGDKTAISARKRYWDNARA